MERPVPRCPVCRSEVRSPEARPFCSSRCRRVDLGNWLGESYRIAGEPVDPESVHIPDEDKPCA